MEIMISRASSQLSYGTTLLWTADLLWTVYHLTLSHQSSHSLCSKPTVVQKKKSFHTFHLSFFLSSNISWYCFMLVSFCSHNVLLHKNLPFTTSSNLLVGPQYDKNKKELSWTTYLGTPVSHINIYCRKKQRLTLETNEQFYSEIPCERTNHNFEEPSRHLIFQQGSRFSFPSLHPSFASHFSLISQAVSFSSQQIFVTTCILLLPYFTIHGKPLLAHCLYASRYRTPHSPSCMRLLSSLIPSRFVTLILTHKYISWSVISFASWNKKTLVKEMTSLIKTSACFYFPGAIFKSPGPSVAMGKSRDCRVKLLCYRDNLPCYESKPWRNNPLKNGLEFKSQAVWGIWSFRSGVVQDSGLIASDAVSLG